jgi:triosephosphate isomerase
VRILIVINYKTYKEATGENAITLSKTIEDAGRETGANIIITPQLAEIYRISKEVGLPIYSQHIDAISYGSNTGSVLAESVKEAGAIGTLVNHSEKRLRLAEIEACVSKAKEVGLATIVCTNNVATSRAAAALKPSAIAVEPPELIGTGISVSKAEPGIISGTVEAVREINKEVKILCGAGITNGKDVKAAIELGAEGVLVASGVVLAKDPKRAALDLISGLK